MKTSELLTSIIMHPVPKGRNLAEIGWHEGYIAVRFHGKPAAWIYGPEIPFAELSKVLKVPYPDALFQHNIKARYKAYKVER